MYVAGRSAEKAQAAITKLRDTIGKPCEVYFLELDLADIDSVVKAAHELSTKEHRLDILINNAYPPSSKFIDYSGIMNAPEGLKTKQGFELQWVLQLMRRQIDIRGPMSWDIMCLQNS